MRMFTAALFTVAKEWNKIWCTCTMEYYPVTKMNEALTHATELMNLESMLSERSQTHKKGHLLYDSMYMKRPEQAHP